MHTNVGPTTLGVLIPIFTLLTVAGCIIWVIVRNLEKHLERARQSEAELRRNYDLTLEAWAKVLEYRDRETEGHSRRLAELITHLAQALGMGETETLQLQRGAGADNAP